MSKMSKKIMIILLMFMSFTTAKAATKTEQIVEDLKEVAKTFDGNVIYEDDRIDIEWYTQDSEYQEISYSYDGNIIEYKPGEIASYEEASDVISHSIYATYLIKTALKLNGYSDEEIQTYFNNENSKFNYEVNGIELKEIGESKTFTSPDGLSKLTMTPILIKIDVARANLRTSSEEPFSPKTTTIKDIIDYLQADSTFVKTMDEGKVMMENEISIDDEYVTIGHTYYWENYHNVSFFSENDIISYEDAEIESYIDAENAVSQQMFADQILSLTLKMNGYTNEQIQEYLLSHEFDYEVNGIEIKELGEEKEYTDSEGNSIEIVPMAFKIDLARANLDKKNIKYEVLEGAKQIIDVVNANNLTFRFNIEYPTFEKSGKIYMDDELVDPRNYISKEGSTIITFNNEYIKQLSAKEHTLKIVVSDGEVETTFNVKKAFKNPATGDNALFDTLILGLSIIGLTAVGLFTKRKVFN